ncbi:MAG: ABC transporter permease [Anaerolineaceae bacterium]|nr:ABC transporter permease [Anaerolineaceae bacterium]
MKINRFSIINLVLLAIIILLCAVPTLITSYDPNEISLTERFAQPSMLHPFGTDDMGRDILSRVLYGGRVTIFSALLITIGSMLIATIWAGSSSYLGGWLDEMMTRVVDGLMNIPALLFALILISIFRPGMMSLILSLMLIRWADDAKILRGHMLGLIRSEFVLAAISIGSTHGRILRKELFPNSSFLILTLFGLNFTSNILSIASLNFLGFGVQLPDAEWGAMINQARPFLQTQPYMMLFPGLAILLTIISAQFAFQFMAKNHHVEEVRYL